MRYRRSAVLGGTFFFTVVTHGRRPFLCEPENIGVLRSAFRSVKQNHPFEIEAIVILPDHLHCIWKLPQGDNRYSMRWNLIKNLFTKNAPQSLRQQRSKSRVLKREQAVWQRRFWEHTIRDDEDFSRHVEYTSTTIRSNTAMCRLRRIDEFVKSRHPGEGRDPGFL
ncbi:MAG: transposase [Proteobacteria bacterium]|nr:transposase [Pseudomonadota bacterium]